MIERCELLVGETEHPEIVAERLEVLQQIAEGKRAVVVLTASSLEDQIPPAEALQKQSIALRRGDRLDRETLIETGNQFPSNWWRDDYTLGANQYHSGSSAWVNALNAAASWCQTNGVNGPCIQLYYPGEDEAGWSGIAGEAQNYLTAINSQIAPGTLEILANEVLGNNGSPQNSGFFASLGGTGTTGWDALIAWAKAVRQYCPNALIGLNDYNVCDYSSGTPYFNAAACVAAYKACYNAGVPLDWLGCEGYWGNQTPQIPATVTQINAIAAQLLPYMSGKCGTAFIAFTEWCPLQSWGATQYLTQILTWQNWLAMFASNQYVMGVTGPWLSFRRSGEFAPSGASPVNWIYDDTNDGGNDNDGVATSNGHVTDLAWLQGWVASNVHQ